LIGQISVRENTILDNKVSYNVVVKLAQQKITMGLDWECEFNNAVGWDHVSYS
jgi:hypothetical protein